MPPKPLHTKVRATLARASPAAVESAATALRSYFQHGRLLGTKNRYLAQAVKNVIADAAPQSSTVNPKHLGEYIAVSSILHCADGWSYLGRALNAQCRGDTSAARHLAYYAELRGALGLLATQGIGVFSKKNAVLQQSGAIEFFHGPTHQATWQALDWWTRQPAGAALLSTVVQPRGVALSDWVSGLGLGANAWSPVGQNWLKAWGLDVRMFGRDRDARDNASYRPTSLRPLASRSEDNAAFVRDFWPLFEPGPSDPFQQLDIHLLRLTLERAFEGVRGSGASGNRDYETAVTRTLRINLGVQHDSQLGKFLLRERDPSTPPLFVASANTASYLDPNYHANAISRAALLLRVATGASSDMFSRADVFAEDFRFWTTSFAESHGICDRDAIPDDLLDLWADIDDAINDLEFSIEQRSDHSFFRLLNGASSPLAVLTGCERVALWGLAAA